MPRRVDPSSILTGAGSAIPGSVSASAVTSGDTGSTSGTLDAHLADPAGAHAASAISIQDLFERYLAGDVEGALGELAALVPPAPGPIGSAGPPWLGSTNTGVPDWGVLKLWDGALNLSSVNSPNSIYPYYWRAPISATGTGVDTWSDPTFNVEDTVGPNVYTGGGMGKAHAGFVTVSMNPGGFPPPADGYPSWRILPSLPLSAGGDVASVVSGIVSPADRGVLALVTWPAGDIAAPLAATSVAEIQARCLAALVLGQGLSSGSGGCDGAPGGIFTVGSPTPYDFPGQAAGQFELDEIHTGVPRVGGTAPVANPAAGQVRLLTDPTAVPVTFVPPTVVGGLPIFGATPAATGGGTVSNFFAYRLPYLKDYSALTGLVYTPAFEKDRFLSKIQPALPPATPMSSGGSYDDFTADYWAIQIARYRHRFVLGVGAPAALRRDGSYALVHFRREQFFEEYVRDGIVPTADKVYSVNLVNWSGAAQVDNLVDLTLLAPTASPAYAVNTSEVSEDPNVNVPALFGINTFTLSLKGGATTTKVSGVNYLVPRDPSLQDANPLSYNLGITDLEVTITDVFGDSYRSHDTVPTAGPLLGDTRFQALNQNPVFLSFSSFSYEGNENIATPASTISIGSAPFAAALFSASLGQVRRQRVEFGYADLDGTGPAPAANAVISTGAFAIPNGLLFTGDANTPVFTEDAKVRVSVRKALNVDPVTGYPKPLVPFDLPSFVAEKYLYHSMKEINDPPGSVKPTYGNPANTTNAVWNATKDREERFLDEVYRYPAIWDTTVPLPVAQVQNLIGPGLPWGFAPVPVQVRPGPLGGSYDGYYLQGFSGTSLISGPPFTVELQVAGLPERNPPYTDGLDAPFPSRGVLLYPKDNYSIGYNPVGPDYSTASTGSPRIYQRVFDAGAANVGASSITLRFWGVTLADFAFAGPGPGGLGLACLAKVPGLTAWLDVGRPDGAGPSKQDPALDGAGCLVVGPNTFDFVDPASQIQYAQVEVNLGPLATLFLNGEGKCPVLVLVALKDNATGKALDWKNVPPTDPTSACRGLVGIEVVVP
jgi:hypothetical protein